MCWGWSTEKGEKLEMEIAAVLGECLCHLLELSSPVHSRSICNGSSFLTSIAMKYYGWLFQTRRCCDFYQKGLLNSGSQTYCSMETAEIVLLQDLSEDGTSLPLAQFIVCAEVHQGGNYNQCTLEMKLCIMGCLCPSLAFIRLLEDQLFVPDWVSSQNT